MPYLFFLGGADLEMETIKALVRRQWGPGAVMDRHLAWGAAASAYWGEIETALKNNKIPVLIELIDDLPPRFSGRKRIVWIDHHGARAGKNKPSSFRQVFDLACLPEDKWTRDLDLIAANDIGHIRALRSLGASSGEICEIRRRDRRAQGVSGADEKEAVRAIENRRQAGRLIIVETSAATSSAVGDFIEPELGGPGAENLLVLTKVSANFFGDGTVVEKLTKTYHSRNCWSGGALPSRGFWGIPLTGKTDMQRQSLQKEICALLG